MSHESFCKKVFCLTAATTLTVCVAVRATDCLMHHFFQYCNVCGPCAQSPCTFPHDVEEAAEDTEERAEHPVTNG